MRIGVWFLLSLVPLFTVDPRSGMNTIDDAIQAITGGNAYVNVHIRVNFEAVRSAGS